MCSLEAILGVVCYGFGVHMPLEGRVKIDGSLRNCKLDEIALTNEALAGSAAEAS